MLVLHLMLIVILIVLGLCFGSFINALVWRLHIKENIVNRRPNIGSKLKNQSTKYNLQSTNDRKYSILYGHSMCPNCQHQLVAKDLIPIISWLCLKRKCRYCKKPISWQYPVVELITAGLFVVSYLFWPTELVASWQYVSLISWLIILIGLIALVVYDIKWMILPDKIVYPLLGMTILSLALQYSLGRSLSDIYGVIWAVVIGGGIFWLIFQISKGKWIGGGDVKLGFLLGLVVAKPEYAFLVLFIASIIAMLFTAPLLAVKKLKKNSKVPFGPFLITASIVVVMLGSNILNAYKSLFGL
jgi:prepilin signal peptidase PulO-like enzyme (type II secretory pathway)